MNGGERWRRRGLIGRPTLGGHVEVSAAASASAQLYRPRELASRPGWRGSATADVQGGATRRHCGTAVHRALGAPGMAVVQMYLLLELTVMAGLRRSESAAVRPRVPDRGGPRCGDGWCEVRRRCYGHAIRASVGGHARGYGSTSAFVQLYRPCELTSRSRLRGLAAADVQGRTTRRPHGLAGGGATGAPGMAGVQMYLLLELTVMAGLRRLESAAVRPRVPDGCDPERADDDVDVRCPGEVRERSAPRGDGLDGPHDARERGASLTCDANLPATCCYARCIASMRTRSGKSLHLRRHRHFPCWTGTHGAVWCAGAAAGRRGEEQNGAEPDACGLLQRLRPLRGRLDVPRRGVNCFTYSCLTCGPSKGPMRPYGRSDAGTAGRSALHGADPSGGADDGDVRTEIHGVTMSETWGAAAAEGDLPLHPRCDTGAGRYVADCTHRPTALRALAAPTAAMRKELIPGLGAGTHELRREEEGRGASRRGEGRKAHDTQGRPEEIGGGWRLGFRARVKVHGDVHLPAGDGGPRCSQIAARNKVTGNARGTDDERRVVDSNGQHRGNGRIRTAATNKVTRYAELPWGGTLECGTGARRRGMRFGCAGSAWDVRADGS